MARPVTLYTLQWGDLSLETVCQKAKEFGYDGVELGLPDHVDVRRTDTAYYQGIKDLLKKYDLRLYAISTHLVGQAVCDNIDERHKAILPDYIWGDGDPEGVHQRATEEMIRTAHAAKMLGEKYRLKVGLSGIIEGSLPIGGLSSSASVIICFLSALCKVNGIHLEPMEMILTAKAAENQYVGVACGKLDQSCEVYSKRNHLLYLDTKDDSYELIPTSGKMKPYKVAIFFSGLERSLKNSKYNLRQDECKAAAYALMGYAGMDYDTFANTRLRDVPFEVFEAYKERLPELWRRRAEHYYSEFARAEKGAELWRKGDLEGYGQLVFESGKSSIYSYECGCDELKKLYEIMTDTDGIYGGRFSGAGFKGCCMALIDPDKAEDIEAKVTAEYLKAFPALDGKYSFHLCESADGVEL